jgi:hypothetical protein
MSHHTVVFNPEIEILDSEEPIEMDCEPANHLYCEQTGLERYPTFTVHLVMNHEEISERIFQTEEEADLCLKTLFPILGKEPCVAIQEFQSYGQ